jgi:hypothetical protein
MSLRDWFAGQALPIAMTDNGIHTAKVAAEYAYEMADAMLAARKETAE